MVRKKAYTSDSESEVEIELNDDEQLEFCEKIMAYPFIYDRSDNQYKNTKKKAEVFKKIGDDFGLMQKQASKLYATLCRRYKTAKKEVANKTKSGAGALDLEQISYNHLLNAMSFLDDVNVPRNTVDNLSPIVEEAGENSQLPFLTPAAPPVPSTSGYYAPMNVSPPLNQSTNVLPTLSPAATTVQSTSRYYPPMNVSQPLDQSTNVLPSLVTPSVSNDEPRVNTNNNLSINRRVRIQNTSNKLVRKRVRTMANKENEGQSRPDKRARTEPLQDLSNALNIIRSQQIEDNSNRHGKAAGMMIETFVDSQPHLGLRVLMDVSKLIASYENLAQ